MKPGNALGGMGAGGAARVERGVNVASATARGNHHRRDCILLLRAREANEDACPGAAGKSATMPPPAGGVAPAARRGGDATHALDAAEP
jgi:hypothetical protein